MAAYKKAKRIVEPAIKTLERRIHSWDRSRYVHRISFDTTIQCLCMIFTILYVTVMSAVIQPMDCTKQADGRYYLDAYPEVVCGEWTSDAGWIYLIYPAWFIFFIYGVGFPVSIFLALGGASTPQDRERWLNSDLCRRRYGWLYTRYDRAHYFWEVCVVFRSESAQSRESIGFCSRSPGPSSVSRCAGNSSWSQRPWHSLTDRSRSRGRASCSTRVLSTCTVGRPHS